MTDNPSSLAEAKDETGWLIEMNDPPVYHIVSSDHDEHWTADANAALRFARREDAQAYVEHIGWTSPPVRVAEHMWPALSRPAVQTDAHNSFDAAWYELKRIGIHDDGWIVGTTIKIAPIIETVLRTAHLQQRPMPDREAERKALSEIIYDFDQRREFLHTNPDRKEQFISDALQLLFGRTG